MPPAGHLEGDAFSQGGLGATEGPLFEERPAALAGKQSSWPGGRGGGGIKGLVSFGGADAPRYLSRMGAGWALGEKSREGNLPGPWKSELCRGQLGGSAG